MTEITRLLVLSSGSGLDIAGELGAILGSGFEVSLVRAANRQTVELALDGAVQYGIVHVLAHGVASLTASVLDFGGERMSEAELVSLMSSQQALQFVFLACCNGYEAAGGIHNALARAGGRLQCADRGSGGGGVFARVLSVLASGSGRGDRPWIGAARRWRFCSRPKLVRFA